MRIAFICFFEENRISGPSNSMSSLTKELQKLGHSCQLFTSSKNVKKKFYLNGVDVCTFSEFSRSASLYDFVVMSGLFDYNIYRAANICVSLGVKYIFSPRSNLMRQALLKNYIRKKIALLTYSGYIIRNATALHFLSQEELKNSIMVNVRSFVVRNGVTGIANTSLGNNRRDKVISFLGRLDVSHKGIDLLLDSLSLIKNRLVKDGWRVEMYGPGSIRNVRTLLEKNNLSDLVSLNGSIVGDDKFLMLSRSRIFVHPSRYEGQPQSVIEAMSQGLIPVLTKGTNMAEYVQHILPCCGFSVQEYSESLVKAIEMANENYSFDSISKFAVQTFDWVSVAHNFSKELDSLMECSMQTGGRVNFC